MITIDYPVYGTTKLVRKFLLNEYAGCASAEYDTCRIYLSDGTTLHARLTQSEVITLIEAAEEIDWDTECRYLDIDNWEDEE